MTDDERKVLTLQTKEGGMGLRNISSNASKAYAASRAITYPLIRQIVEKSTDLPDEEEVSDARRTTMLQVRNDQQQYTKDVKDRQTEEMQRKLSQTSETGASSWIGALLHNMDTILAVESFRMPLLYGTTNHLKTFLHTVPVEECFRQRMR